MNEPNLDLNREEFLERPLPSSPDAERAILGGILLDNDLLAQAIEEVAPADFYSPNHRRIFKAMTALFERGERIDPILIGEELNKDGSIDSMGGVATITNLTYGLPRFSDISVYTRLVLEKATIRNLVKVCNQITTHALAEDTDAGAVLNHAEQMIFDVCNQPSASKPEKIGALAFSTVQKNSELARSGVKVAGLTTGLTDLDDKLGGLKKSDLIIVAARPSMGKTALCLTIAQNAAVLAKAVVLVFSLEMSKEALIARLVCSRAKVDLHRYLNLYVTREEWQRINEAVDFFQNLDLIIDDTPGITSMEMLAKSRRVFAEYKKLDLIVVDYLQLMKSSRRVESETAEVSQNSKDLKAIAKLLDVPLVAISSLSRAPEARNPPRPLMSDLRQSGQIEFDADVVCFVYREEMYKPSEENAGVAELLIAKQRNGPTGVVRVAFMAEFTHFANYYGGDEFQHSFDNVVKSSPDEPEDLRFR